MGLCRVSRFVVTGAVIGLGLFLPAAAAGETEPPAVIAPPADPRPVPPAAAGETPPADPSGGMGQIVIPETFDQHFLVFQGGRQIGIERARSELSLQKGARQVAESVERETALVAGGGTLHKKIRQQWLRGADGQPLRYSLVIEEAGQRVAVDGAWQPERNVFGYKVTGDEGAASGEVPLRKPAETVFQLDGVVLREAGQLQAGGELTRYILRLYPPQFGLGREKARVIKKETGPDGHGVTYTLEIADATNPDGSPAPLAPPPRIVTVNELGHPLEIVDFPIRRLAVRPDLAVMPAAAPVFANSLKPIPADPQHPVPIRAAQVDTLDRSFLILSASALAALHPANYQDIAVEKDQDRTVAVVKLKSVRPDGRTPMQVLAAADRAAVLQPTSKIQSDHRDIRARAEALDAAVLERYAKKQAALNLPVSAMPAPEHDYRLAEAIGGWVYRTLAKDSAGPADASALHALYYRHGDCTEHANLVVALCRARGVPARICRGLVLEGGELTAHQWAEVFVAGLGAAPAGAEAGDDLPAGDTLGMWLPVDATLGRLGVPAAYVLLGYDDPGLDATLLTLLLDGDAVWMAGKALPTK